MVTRLYFHAALNSLPNLPQSEQSALTSNKDVDAQTVNRSMNTTIGTGQVTLDLVTNATVSLQRYYFSCFVSQALSGISSITAQTWNYNFAANAGSTNANFPCGSAGSLPVRVVCYVWRPSTQTKVGDILDGNSASVYRGVNTERSQVGTFAGALVSSVQDGDVIVFEVWFEITQGVASANTCSFCYDGTTVTLTNFTAALTNHATFIETPQNLTFQTAIAVTRTASDTTSISESVGRTVGNIRTAIDTTTISESVAEQLGLKRSPSDTVAITESIARRLTLKRTASDTSAISESIAETVNLKRAISDTVTLSESVAEVVALKRAISDTVVIAESVARLRQIPRPISDTVPISESIARKLDNKRTASDTSAITESVARRLTLKRAIADTTIITESVIDVNAVNRSVSDTVPITESVIKAKQAPRAISDTVPITESVDASIGLSRVAADTTIISELVDQSVNLKRAIAESVTISESVAEMVAIKRAIADTVAMSESVARIRGVPRPVSDTVAISESVIRRLTLKRAISDTVTLSESVARELDLTRAIVDSIIISESVAEMVALDRDVSDIVPITESVARIRTVPRAISDTVVIGESVIRRLGLKRTDSDTTSISESIARQLTLKRAISESVAITESIAKTLALKRAISDTVAITESIARIRGVPRSVSDTVTISESVARLMASIRAIQETTAISEGVSVTVDTASAFSRSVTDNVALSESVARSIALKRTVSESNSISEAVARQLALTRQVGEGAVLFGTTGQYMNLGNDAALWSQPKTKFSFSIWVKPDALNTGAYQNLVNHNWQAIGSFIFYFANVGYASAFALREVAAQKSASAAGSVADAGQWIHFAGTYDNSLGSANIKLYKNKVLSGTTGIATEAITTNAGLLIGGSSGSMPGQTRDFRFWYNKALTQQEVNDTADDLPTAPVPDYWLRMDEGTGNPKDAITGTKTATLTAGASWLRETEAVPLSELVSRRLGLNRTVSKTGLFLDNIDDSIVIPNRAAINNLDDYTITFWLYPTINVAPSTPNIVNKLYPSNNGFILYFTGSSLNLNFRTVGNTGVGVSVSNTTYLTAGGFNRWYHIGVTVTRSTGAMKLYIDGVLRNSGTNLDIGANLSGTVANLTINGANSPNKFAGDIRDFRLYRSAQDAAIPSIMNELPTAPVPDFWLKFDEGSGSPLDAMNPIAPVTLNGGPVWDTTIETVPIAESVSRRLALTREGADASDIIDISESVARELDLSRAIADTSAISESVARKLTIKRTITDPTIPITESVARRLSNQRIISDTVPITESIARRLTLSRIVAPDNVPISEAVNRAIGVIRELSDIIDISDSVDRIVTIQRTISDSIPITESIARKLTLKRSASDSVVVTDSVIRVKGLQRTLSETVNLSESVIRRLSLKRAILDTLPITESIARSAKYSRTVGPDIVPISDLVTRMKTLERTVEDTLDVTDSVDRELRMQRFITDSIDITESVETLREGLSKQLVRDVLDSVPVSDSVERQIAINRYVTDTVGGLPFYPSKKIPETGGLLCSLLKQNWSIADPPSDAIRWSSWYTGNGRMWVYCSDIITVPPTISIGWYLRDYKYFVNVYIFARSVDDLQKFRNHAEDLIQSNPTALTAYGIDMIKIDEIVRNDLYDQDYQNDIFGLILTVSLKAMRTFHQFV